MKYYTNRPNKSDLLIIIATSEKGTELVAKASDSKVTIEYTDRPANIYDGLEEITQDKYFELKNEFCKNTNAFMVELGLLMLDTLTKKKTRINHQ